MNSHALGILEFDRLRRTVAAFARSAPGIAVVRALAPSHDREWIEREQTRVVAMRALYEAEARWMPEAPPDAHGAVRRARLDQAVLSGEELNGCRLVLAASRQSRAGFADPRRAAIAVAVLQPLADRLIAERRIEEEIAAAIDDTGAIRDDASPTLRRLRRELRSAESELVQLLERVMQRLESHHQVSDMSVTVRNGRFVIPVRREGRGAVGGIVHDRSATGQTVFVEPPAAVEFGNRIRDLEAEEAAEIERILRELSGRLFPIADAMADAFDALAELDGLTARARFAIAFDCAPIEFGTPTEGIALVRARHPLLVARHSATGGLDALAQVVPFDLALDVGERTLLVSGPNTGGKTVLLKALGLLVVAAQSGLPVPVATGTRLACFDDVFADVGDEQSIEASLSTFSAHLKNLGEILEGATADSLVLADELGSGTDPTEGAALGSAILETLTQRGVLTIATTHLGQLKLLATEVPGVVNASLQFDEVRLAPTYRLIKGIPGRSYGISIARRLRLPDAVIANAESRVSSEERDLAVLLATIEGRDAALAEREQLLEVEQRKIRSRIATVHDREQKARAKERELERAARGDARRLLLDARGEVERAIQALGAEVRAALDVAAPGSRETVLQTLDRAAKGTRQQIEQAAAEQQAGVERLTAIESLVEAKRAPRAPEREVPRSTPVPIGEGDTVLVDTLGGRTGRVVTLLATRGEARVAVGALTVTVPVGTLTRVGREKPQVIIPTGGGALPDVEASPEVDVRGLRVHEVDDAVMHALDAAVRADLRALRIIHGKGTGALRERVTEMLRKDTRISAFRLGAWNEGGAGVTVAELA
jgi:DNA mismatch repair protein MutS2